METTHSSQRSVKVTYVSGTKTASLNRAAGLLKGKYEALKKHYKQVRKGWS